MTQEQERIKRMQEVIDKALAQYAEDEQDTSSGFDILRYARMGYLKGEVK